MEFFKPHSIFTIIRHVNNFFSSYLVSVACDGAAVISGRKSGVAELLKDEFPSVIVWRCANHRLELSVADTVTAVAGINRFTAFMDNPASSIMHHRGTTGNYMNVLCCWKFSH
jgi:hypothetical protein